MRRLHLIAFAALAAGVGACASAGPTPTDARAFPAALHAVRSAPGDAPRACGALRDPGLQADCYTLAATTLAADDGPGARALCGAIGDDALADECGFQLAEALRSPASCTAAGRFAYDCTLHLWPIVLAEALPPDVSPGGFEPVVAALIEAHLLELDDPQPWAIAYAAILGDDVPLDLRACEAAPGPDLRRLCHDAGVLVYSDRLSAARRAGTFPCDGSEPPPDLAFAPDRGLATMYHKRQRGDLCHDDGQGQAAWRDDAAPAVHTPPGTAHGRELALSGRIHLWPPDEDDAPSDGRPLAGGPPNRVASGPHRPVAGASAAE